MNLYIKKTILFSIILLFIFNKVGLAAELGRDLPGVGAPVEPRSMDLRINTDLYKSPSVEKAGGGAGTAICAGSSLLGAAGLSSSWCQIVQIGLEVYGIIEKALDKIGIKMEKLMRDVIAKRIMDYIVDQTVKWIQGGGEPKFITNWNGFLKDVGDIAFDSVAKEIGLADLCSPFGLQLKLAFLPVPKFSERISCSLDQFVKNIQNFYIDFSVGGWEGYLLSWEPNNNLYGAILLAQDEAAKRKAEATETEKSKAVANKGFLSAGKACKAGSNMSGNLDDVIQQEGGGWDMRASYCSNQLSECFDNYNKFAGGGEACQSQYDSCISGVKDSAAINMGFVKDDKGGYCDPKDMIDQTPGSMVGEAVANSITSDSQWAANIQSWTSALVNALINRLMSEGLSAMKGSQDYTSPSRYYPPEYAGLANQQFQQDKRDTINLINPIKNEWTYLLTKKGNSVVYAREILTTLQQLQANNCTSTTGQLVTAADIASASSTVDNLNAEIVDLKTKIAEAENVIDQINSAQTDIEMQAANFAANNFLNTYNTLEMQQQIVSSSERAAAAQQEFDLKKQLEGENILDPNTNQLVNNGLRQRLTECRAPSAGPIP